jgi:hypothetical protein
MTRWAVLSITLFAAFSLAEDGSKPLFNGKDLSGWTAFLPNDQGVKPEQVWSVKDGVITCAGAKKPNGYIITNQEFDNYVLKLQWRFPAGTPGGNSGVLLHVQTPDKVWPKSVEAQLQSGQAGDFWLIDSKLNIAKERNNSNSARNYIRIGEKCVNGKAERKQYEKPFGEWNQYEIHCNSNNVRLMINGQLVNEGRDGELSKGKIALQAEGADIQFRNIEIRTK